MVSLVIIFHICTLEKSDSCCECCSGLVKAFTRSFQLLLVKVILSSSFLLKVLYYSRVKFEAM